MQKRDNTDNEDTWIDMFDPICVAQWTQRLNLSEDELKIAVRTVGGYAKRLQDYVLQKN